MFRILAPWDFLMWGYSYLSVNLTPPSESMQATVFCARCHTRLSLVVSRSPKVENICLASLHATRISPLKRAKGRIWGLEWWGHEKRGRRCWRNWLGITLVGWLSAGLSGALVCGRNRKRVSQLYCCYSEKVSGPTDSRAMVFPLRYIEFQVRRWLSDGRNMPSKSLWRLCWSMICNHRHHGVKHPKQLG